MLRCVILKCLGCMSREQAFAEHIANESDFLDIVMRVLASQMEHLPYAIPYTPKEGLGLQEQIKNNFSHVILDQFKEFIDQVYFLKDILN